MCLVIRDTNILLALLFLIDARKLDFVRGKQQRRRPAWSSAQSDQRLCCLLYGKYVKLKIKNGYSS